MSLRRFFGVFSGIVGAALLVLVLYIAFGDLSRHKGRIEAFVTNSLGRPFAIDGPFRIKLLPAIDVSAEHVRLGNAPGSSQPQMVEVGKVAVQIGVWSLISGPADVRTFELNDVTVLLERGPDGKGNWVMGAPKTDDEEVDDEEDADVDTDAAPKTPLIIHNAQLHNVRVIYREADKPDRTLQLDKLAITPGQNELLALDGQGMLNDFPLALKGEVGPLKSLLSVRDMHIAMQLSLGKLALDAQGVLGSLQPLDGADLTLKIEQPDIGAMLEALSLPVVATGPLHIETQLKDIGELTQLDLNAMAGDFKIDAKGTLQSLSLVGSDLTLKVEQPQVDALLKALDLPVVASGPMRIDTRLQHDGAVTQLDFDAKLGDLKANAQGTLARGALQRLSLAGSDLTLEVEQPEITPLLKALKLPTLITGPMQIQTRLKHDGTLARVDLNAKLGNLKVTANGALANGALRKMSLVGSDLTLKLEQPEVGALLKTLKLPAIATGPMQIDTRLKHTGAMTQLDFNARAGDIKASANGNLSNNSLRKLTLAGSDLTLKVEQPEVGALLKALDLPVITTGPMQIDTRLKHAGALTHVDLNATVGNLKASANGSLASDALKKLTLNGSDLTLKVEQPEVGATLKALELPVIATGPMLIDARLKKAGALTQVDLNAGVGDIKASAHGTLEALSLAGSDIKFEASAADAARLASVFDVSGVPASPITVAGHTVASDTQIRFDALTAAIADASVRANGSMQLSGDRKLATRFEVTAANLAKLRATLPTMKVAASGELALAKGRIEVKDLKATLDKTQLAGSVLLINGSKHVEAQLSSPHLDLTPFFPEDKPAETATAQAKPEQPKQKFMFNETPLPLKQLKDIDAQLHLACGELVLGERSLRNFDSKLRVAQGKLTFDVRAAGAHEGTLQGTGTLMPANDGTAHLDLKLDLHDVRASLASANIAPADVPPLGVALDIKIHGGSPRQMASGANGHLLLTQGSGQTKSGLIGAFGGDVVRQLAQKLNPFAKDEPFMKLDCTVARADIVNGQVTLKPVLLQTEKVTITAQGTIDLHTENLLLDFHTRPREGIGVSPGMFTNPLIRLEGTLMSPQIGMGAKGVASGAVAVATGGVSVVAGGLFDRAKGEKDLCKKTLAEARSREQHAP